jgi:hypothetical protein
MANEQTFDGNLTIKTVLQLIRYDIPVLTLGKSSIGKSYTLIDITKKWNITHSLLYIGSEKSENIEGVPKLTERGGKDDILEYLKPYWFPNAEVISESVSNGRKIFEKFIKNYYDGDFDASYLKLEQLLNGLSYLQWGDEKDTLTKGKLEKEAILIERDEETGKETILNDKPFPMIKVLEKRDDNEGGEEVPDEYFRDDLKDFCAYLTTVLGYGNYWLILDEIDKVEKYDKDKFAPLLHIVRERTLKNFRMIDVNDGKGIGVPAKVKGNIGGYQEIIDDLNVQLDNKQSVLDTRVMAIANKTENIEEALFRRFVQVIAEDLLIWRRSQINLEQSNIESCIKSVKDAMSDRGIEQGDYRIDESLVQRIDEINLQWQYNFLPKLMNKNDLTGNLFIQNILRANAGKGVSWSEEKKFTSLFKVLEDNFEDLSAKGEVFDTSERLFDCLTSDVLQPENIGENVKQTERQSQSLRGEIEQLINTFGSYDAVADDISDKLRDSYETMVVEAEGATRLQGLTSWTDTIKKYMEAVMYTTDGKLVPLEVSKYLVPALVNVFYTEMANDSVNQVDNIASRTKDFQDFFLRMHNDLPSGQELEFDAKASQKALYGATKSELNSMNQDEVNEVAEEALIAYNEAAFENTTVNKLAIKAMDSSFPTVVLNMSNAVLGKLKDYTDAQRYVKNNYSSQVKNLQASLIATNNSKKKVLAAVLDKLFLK